MLFSFLWYSILNCWIVNQSVIMVMVRGLQALYVLQPFTIKGDVSFNSFVSVLDFKSEGSSSILIALLTYLLACLKSS